MLPVSLLEDVLITSSQNSRLMDSLGAFQDVRKSVVPFLADLESVRAQ